MDIQTDRWTDKQTDVLCSLLQHTTEEGILSLEAAKAHTETTATAKKVAMVTCHVTRATPISHPLSQRKEDAVEVSSQGYMATGVFTDLSQVWTGLVLDTASCQIVMFFYVSVPLHPACPASP